MTHKQHLISRADLARLAKRSRSAITHAARGPLAPARVGRRIDAAHPAAVAWGRERGVELPPRRSGHVEIPSIGRVDRELAGEAWREVVAAETLKARKGGRRVFGLEVGPHAAVLVDLDAPEFSTWWADERGSAVDLDAMWAQIVDADA